MIAFACKQCGKRFERPDHLAGTLVFCGCGTGTHVPWESTLPAEPGAVPTADGPKPRWVETGAVPEPQPPRVLPRNPDNCFNHPDTPKIQACAGCKEPFCAACLVGFQGELVCGPCKNFRLRKLQEPPRLSVLALLATLFSVGAGAVWPFVVLAAAGLEAKAPAIIALGAFGLIPQLVALLMAAWAMRAVETDGRVSGRSWAITGLVSVLVSSALIVLVSLLVLQAAG
jgi:hypothetical protein